MSASGRAGCLFGLACSVAILYGSFVPFSFQWRPLGEAWDAFLGLGADSGLRLSRTDFATNLALFVPLAFCWAGCLRVDRVGRGAALLLVVAGCAAFSAGIEFVQVFLPRRSSSIYDLTANISGAFVGVLAWELFGTRAQNALTSLNAVYLPSNDLHRRACRILAVAAVPYALALGAADGWFAGSWLAADDALSRLDAVPLLPFYAHQQADIVRAGASALWQCVLYVPLGVALRVLTRAPALSRRDLLIAGACGAGLAAVLEGGRLFVPGKHPDVGDILIAAVGAMIGFAFWPALVRFVRGDATPADTHLETRPTGTYQVPLLPRAVAVVLAAVVIAALSRFPVMPAALAAGLAAYAFALTRWPWLWLWVVPAALPLLDLAPFSGWFFFDEFDFVVLTTLGVSLWYGRARILPAISGAGAWLILLLATSILISTLLGLWPLQPLDGNAFSSYYSHYNALRVAKGFLWPFLLLSVLQTNVRDGVNVRRHFTGGVVAGLAGVVALGLWERIVYPGLLDFSREFRVGTFFSSMHNGGSSIEAYLVMTMPFLAVGAYLSRSWPIRIAMGLLFIAATYVLMVTFSRGGYLAYAVSLAVLIAASMRTAAVQARIGPLAGLLAVCAVAMFVAMPIFLGSFAQKRMSTSVEDLGVRVSHWDDAMAIMDPGLARQFFGMGLGRYPEIFFFRNREGRLPATFRYESEGQNTYVKLGFGDRLYLEQVVNVVPNHIYRLSLDVRGSKGPAVVNVLVCERTYFYSYGCESATIDSKATSGQWERREATIDSGRLGRGTWPARRPVKLSVENASPGTWVDVDNIALLDESGTNLVENGDFSRGNAHWFFSSKDHLPWHTKDLWVGLLFEQGWLGVLAFATIVLYALGALTRDAWRGDLFSGAAISATIGYLCVGLFDGLVEAPRLTTMFFLTLGVAGVAWKVAKIAGPEPIPRVAASGIGANARGLSPMSTAPDKRGVVSDHRRGEAPVVPSPKSTVYHMLVGIGVGALLIGFVTHSRWAPYNLRDLPNPAHPYAAPVILAIFGYWSFATPVWMARSFAHNRIAAVLFPVFVVLQGIIAWAIIHYAAYPVMIHKVTGSPVLGWPWWWEDLTRFAVLEGTLFLLLTGACMIVLIGTGMARMRQLWLWLGWAILLLPVAHHVIIVEAATDNLTELMAGGGTPLASLALAAWMLALGAGASILAVCLATRRHRVLASLSVVVFWIPLGYVLASLGTEQALEKYGAMFSSLQFLLSTDRAHYATGWDLGLRYLVFHSALLCAVAIAQYPLWRMPPRPERAAAPSVSIA